MRLPQPRNLAIHAIERFPAFRVQLDSPGVHRIADALESALSSAPAFLVPSGLFTNKDDLTKLFELIRLPTTPLVLENGELALLVIQSTSAAIDPKHGDLLIWPVFKSLLSPVAGVFHQKDLPQAAVTGRLPITPILITPGAESFLKRVGSDFFSPYLTLLGELCFLLACRNITTEVVEAPHRLNRARIARGKLPFTDYHQLVVHMEGVRRVGLYGPEGGHASPRTHIRRGHIRRLKTGPIWVMPTVVNPGHGWIKKDYVLAA